MKAFRKITRRTFLLLSPLVFAMTLGECQFLKDLFVLNCIFNPSDFVARDFGFYPPNISGGPIYVGAGGEILIGRSPSDCAFLNNITVTGNPDLNSITEYGIKGVGNIIVGSGGSIVRLIPFDELSFITNPAGTIELNEICQDISFGSVVSPNVIAVGDSGTVIKSTDNV
jgi:hypothetical protein